MKDVIVIIDLGTTNMKATLKDKTGETVSVKTLSTPVFYGENSMEIDPELLWRGVLDCCRGAVAGAGEPVHANAVVLSSMAASFALGLVDGGGVGEVQFVQTPGWIVRKAPVKVYGHGAGFYGAHHPDLAVEYTG